jgi:hypothetical protein
MNKVIYPLLCLALAGPLAPLTGQTQAQKNVLQRLMRDKLQSSKSILEGLALEDFGRVRQNAEQLVRLSNLAEWAILKTPEYARFSSEFRRAAENIARKAKAKNLDGATLGYVELVQTCVRCHQYVRQVRQARLAVPSPVLSTALRP